MIHRRKAYILLAVLGIAVIVTALGISFVESHSTAMPESVNRYGAMRALYLAESGVAIGSHFLMYPPSTVNYGQYYTGANNVAIDATSDYTDISVLRSDGWSPPKTDLNLFRITATGVARDPDGSVRGKRKVTAEVVLPAAAQWQIPHAGFIKTGATIPAPVRFVGNLHCNGSVTGALGSFCNGRVSATGTALWFGGGWPSPVQSFAAGYTGPAGTLSKYQNYTIKGCDYVAYTGYTSASIANSDAVALNAINMSATNPGRIISCKSGNINFDTNTDLTGTLLVNGRFQVINAGNHIIRAVDGFPALIVNGDIRFGDNNATLTVIGSVICNGVVDLNSKSGASLVVTGSLISASGFSGTRGDTPVQFTWDTNRSTFWDVETTPTPQPLTVLNWKED